MNYDESRDYIRQALTFGIRLGLERMSSLMERLGHPEKSQQVIHIAGTNGKGSVTSYCATILAAADLKVGVYTSPYIERFTERIRVLDGRRGLDQLTSDEAAGEITPDEFAGQMTRIRAVVDQMLAAGEEHPTEFELITACAFLYFAQQNCDYIVLETGLGGRLDSTNVVTHPVRVIITALGYDHQDRLGHSLQEIAAEKAGIIKPGCPVWLYDPLVAVPHHPAEAQQALAVIRSRCTELAAPLTVLGPSAVQAQNYQMTGQSFIFKGNLYETRLLGLFQPLNAALALAACRDLVPPAALAEGIRRTRWPARLELFSTPEGLPVLLDGAHNPQGCTALGDALDRLMPGQPIVFLLGLLADKDYDGMLRGLFAQRSFTPAALICVTPDNPRALPAADLAAVIAELKIVPANGYNGRDMIPAYDCPTDGLAQALALATALKTPVCAFGSLYLVGQLRSRIKARSQP